MADSALSSDLEAEVSSPKDMALLAPKGSKAKAKSKVPRALRAHTKNPSAQEKGALRCHKTLERQYDKARRSSVTDHHTTPASVPVPSQPVFGAMPHHLPPELLSLSSRASESHPAFDMALSQGAPTNLPQGPAPSSEDTPVSPTYMPASVCAPAVSLSSAGVDNQLDIHSMLSDALAKILAAGIQQSVNPGLAGNLQTSVQGRLPDRPTTSTHHEYVSSEESDNGEEYPEEMEFSEDKGLLPEQLAFTGLFRSSVFKSLLHKAKVTNLVWCLPQLRAFNRSRSLMIPCSRSRSLIKM